MVAELFKDVGTVRGDGGLFDVVLLGDLLCGVPELGCGALGVGLLVDDAAQAITARYAGPPVGTFGDAACFSFYPTKNMHTIEGGMVVTTDPTIVRRLRLLRDQGMRERYQYEIVVLNAG